MKRRRAFSELPNQYLFPEIARRRVEYLEKHPNASIIDLGIGNTILPLIPPVAKAMEKAARSMTTPEGYVGYGPEQGILPLRQKIVETYYSDCITPDEIFVSDGAKCDVGRLQVLFGGGIRVGLQDPSYPVYFDGSIINGVSSIKLLPCHPDNGFLPDLTQTTELDLLYICNPNNPTGAAYTKAQLEELVIYAKKSQFLILYDAAYSHYIQGSDHPRSIYEIEGADEVAIEVNSLSKTAGFTGVRLGWTVVPKALRYQCGFSLWNDWSRLTSTLFNGASYLSQIGGIAALEAMDQLEKTIAYYMENGRRLKKAFSTLGYDVYGGEHAPYLWIHAPGELSWDLFESFLNDKQLIVTPGVGYGPSGEHFFRLSSFAQKEIIDSLLMRL